MAQPHDSLVIGYWKCGFDMCATRFPFSLRDFFMSDSAFNLAISRSLTRMWILQVDQPYNKTPWCQSWPFSRTLCFFLPSLADVSGSSSLPRVLTLRSTRRSPVSNVGFPPMSGSSFALHLLCKSLLIHFTVTTGHTPPSCSLATGICSSLTFLL